MTEQGSKLKVWLYKGLWRFEMVIYLAGKRQVLRGENADHKALLDDFQAKYAAAAASVQHPL